MLSVKHLPGTVGYIIRVLRDNPVDVSKEMTPHFQRNAVILLSTSFVNYERKHKNLL